MGIRIKSLKNLGKGAWRVASIVPMGSATGSRRRKAARQGLSVKTPHDLLWDAVQDRWPDAARELPAEVPGRKFRIDIGFAKPRLAIEVDGFQHHGKYLKDFRRDRERQNALTLAGWRILRFAAGDIRKDLDSCLKDIEMALARNSETAHRATPKDER